tara:strand:- start:89 stop:1690 length:1602 start_codon:yes stop_codon:yes gene_type:complete
MTVQIHDSLARTKHPLRTLKEGHVGMYVCGPTVYDDSHIGHLMGPVVFDTIARWLLARGYTVQFVVNITDIDDKIINRAIETGEDWNAISVRYTEQYFDHLRALSVDTITDFPRCTDYVEQMVTFIQDLIDKDMAYVAADGVYYRVPRHEGYGKLSGRKIEDMQAGARVTSDSSLEHPADFALWKLAKPGEPTWDSPWGAGRPGWHIECSVMSSELLGSAYDVHGGGDDLKFPHHENEIAQSEAHGDDFASLWMHHGLVQYEGRKVAKSDPRMQDAAFRLQFQAHWLLDTYGAPAVRYFLVNTPYRRPVDFGPTSLDGARKGLLRLYRLLGERLEVPNIATLDEILARDLTPELAAHRTKFCEAMDDDFNTSIAVAELFTMAGEAKAQEGDAQAATLDLLRDLGRTIGLLMPGDAAQVASAGSGEGPVEAVLDALLVVRTAARGAKDFETGDGVRDLLTGNGVQILDGADGTTWELDGPAADGLVGKLVDGALALRASARERKAFATSDGIRDGLTAAGITILDSADGTTWQI